MTFNLKNVRFIVGVILVSIIILSNPLSLVSVTPEDCNEALTIVSVTPEDCNEALTRCLNDQYYLIGQMVHYWILWCYNGFYFCVLFMT
jgi:hypothetical protein